MKLCNSCKLELDFCQFWKDKSKIDKLATICIACKKQYKLDNKEHVAKIKKACRLKHIDKIKAYEKSYKDANKIRNKLQHREWVKTSKNNGTFKKAIITKKYDINKKRRKVYEMYRRLFDPIYKIKKNLRIRLNKALHKNFKNCSAVSDLGCTIDFFKQYLEKSFYNNMTWDNYGSVWDIDHIIPLSSIDITADNQVKKLCHYTNLQPLIKLHNYIKGDRIMTTKELIELKEL